MEKAKLLLLDINPNLWFFNVHFKTDPVMPGCLGLDAVAIVRIFLCWSKLPGYGKYSVQIK